MRLSVSLPDEDVELIDEYARVHGLATRSSVLQRAVRLLRDAELEEAYADAWAEWTDAGEADGWDAIADDGLGRN